MSKHFCALIILLMASISSAHDTWVAPERFHIPRGGTVRLSLTSGMEFPTLDYAVKDNRIARAIVVARNQTSSLGPGTAAAHALTFSKRLTSSGVAVIAIETKPNSIELTPDQVDEYLEEIGAKETIGPIWRAMPEPKRWRELYAKHAKTFVRVGHAQNDSTWARAVGMRFELVPLSDPSTVSAGGTITFTLLDEGKPVPAFPIGVVREGSKAARIVITDDRGNAEITSLQAGRYLVRATKLRRSTSKDYDWESDFTTVTFGVAAP